MAAGRGSWSARDKARSTPATLLRYALGQDVAVVLAGMASTKQLEEDLRIVHEYKPLTEEETAALTKKVNAKDDGWKR